MIKMLKDFTYFISLVSFVVEAPNSIFFEILIHVAMIFQSIIFYSFSILDQTHYFVCFTIFK